MAEGKRGRPTSLATELEEMGIEAMAQAREMQVASIELFRMGKEIVARARRAAAAEATEAVAQ